MKKICYEIAKNFDPSAVCRMVLNYFITACGVTLLLYFFCWNAVMSTRENIVSMVLLIFVIECVLKVLCSILVNFSGLDVERAYKVQNELPKAVLDKKDSSEDESRASNNKRIIAVHEAGHAVMAYLKNAKRFDVDMIKGCVNTNYSLLSPEQCKEHIMVIYAGAIAEELEFGYFCSGSFGSEDSDFERAKDMIMGYITMTDKTVSKAFLETELNSKVIEFSNELYAESKALLISHKDMISYLADKLISKDSLTTEEVREILTNYSL